MCVWAAGVMQKRLCVSVALFWYWVLICSVSLFVWEPALAARAFLRHALSSASVVGEHYPFLASVLVLVLKDVIALRGEGCSSCQILALLSWYAVAASLLWQEVSAFSAVLDADRL